MRVLLTGGTGFVGAHVVQELLDRGDEVTLLARNPMRVPAFREAERLSVVRGDLRDQDGLRDALLGHDACIHIAMIWEDALTELELADTRAAVRLFEAAAAAGIAHLVYTSSTAVHRPFQARMSEGMRLAPTDLYGATKAANEIFLSAFSYRTGMRCNTIRVGPTVGAPAAAGARVTSDRRIEGMVRAALRGDEIRVIKHDGRQFVGASDVAKVYSGVLRSDANRETYLAVATNYTTWEQIAHEAIALCRSASRVVVEDGSASRARDLFDVAKLERELGFAFDSRGAMRDHLRHLIATARGPSSFADH